MFLAEHLGTGGWPTAAPAAILRLQSGSLAKPPPAVFLMWVFIERRCRTSNRAGTHVPKCLSTALTLTPRLFALLAILDLSLIT